jgi:hypothetical protein
MNPSGNTAEKSGDSIQLLNQPRFSDAEPMTMKFSCRDTSIAAVKGLNGRYGIYPAVDYRRLSI